MKVQPNRQVKVSSSVPEDGSVVAGNTVELRAELINFEAEDEIAYQWFYSADDGATYNKVETATESVYTFTANDSNCYYRYMVQVHVKSGEFETDVESAITNPLPYGYQIKVVFEEGVSLDAIVESSKSLLVAAGIRNNELYSSVNYEDLSTGSTTFVFKQVKTGVEGEQTVAYADLVKNGESLTAFLVEVPGNLYKRDRYDRCRNPEGFWADTTHAIPSGTILNETVRVQISKTDSGSKIAFLIEKQEQEEEQVPVSEEEPVAEPEEEQPEAPEEEPVAEQEEEQPEAPEGEPVAEQEEEQLEAPEGEPAAEPEEEQPEAPEGEPAAEPEEEVQVEPQEETAEEPETEKEIIVHSSLEGMDLIPIDETVTLTAELIGFDDIADYTCQWQYSTDGVNYVDIEGANDLTYQYQVNMENLFYNWQLLVKYND